MFYLPFAFGIWLPTGRAVSPNNHMQRAGTHKVLSRGRLSVMPNSTPHTRVLTGQRAGADVGR